MAGITDLLGGGAPAQSAGSQVGSTGCNMERLARLPIRDMYKQKMAEFCSDPANASQCQLLCDTPDQDIVKAFNQVEGAMMKEIDQVQAGQPSELMQNLAQVAPEQAQGLMQAMSSPEAAELANMKRQEIDSSGIAGMAPSQMSEVPKPMDTPQGFANGGLASLGRYGDTKMAHVANGEMVVPQAVMADRRSGPVIRGLMEQHGADPDRYTVGGRRMSINPQTGEPEFFFAAIIPMISGMAGSAMFGGTVAAALGTSALVGGAIAGGLGTMLGSFITTGDFGQSVQAGLMGGLTSFAAGSLMQGLSGAADVAGGAEAGLELGFNGQGASNVAELGYQGANTASTMSNQALGLGASDFAGASTDIGSSLAGGAQGTASASGLSSGFSSPSYNGNLLGSTPTSYKPLSFDFASSGGAGAGAAGGGAGGSSMLGGVGEWWDGLSSLQKVGVVGGAATLAAGFMEDPNNTTTSASSSGANYDALMPYYKCMADNNNDESKCSGLKTWAEAPSSSYMAGTGTANTGASQTFPSVSTQVNPVGVSPGGYYYGNSGNAQSYTRPVFSNPISQQQLQPVYAASGGHINGPGNGKSDSIPAYLSDGEFVLTANAVRGAGNGDRQAGAEKLYRLMSQLEARA